MPQRFDIDFLDSEIPTIGIVAAIAEAEREATPKRTAEAFAVVKLRLN